MSKYIISKISIGDYNDKGSSFHAVAEPAYCIDDLKSKLFIMKGENPDASHICYGYRIKMGQRLDEFSSDAGEPKGSAGPPILNALKRKNLINSFIIIVRYYGGSKLGIPRLMYAYGTAAENAIKNADLTLWIEKKQILITYPYEFKGIMNSLIKRDKAEVIFEEFGEKINMQLKIDVELAEMFINKVNELSSGSAQIVIKN